MDGGKDKYYFDTAAIFKYYRDEKGSLPLRRLVSDSPHPIFVSPLTILEFISKLMKYYRGRSLKKRALRKIIKRLRRDVGISSQRRPFFVVQIPDGSFKRAKMLILQHGYTNSLGANDVLHIAIVDRLKRNYPGVIMVTSDTSLICVCERSKIFCFNPEIELDALSGSVH